jgi:hypothetical protein
MSHNRLGIPKLDKLSPNEEIVACCANPTTHSVLSRAGYPNKVVRISDQALDKFGVGITREDADNQRTAYETAD